MVHGLDIAPLAAARNLEAVRDHPNFHYVQGDIRDPEVIRGFFRPEASVLYHLASVVGVRRYMEDPLSLIDIAIIGTRHLIALAVEHEVRILFTSTSEVYGRNPAVPWKEDDDRVLGATSVDRWSYAASKGVCEQMLYGVHRKTGLPFSIVRFFNVYGPRQAPIYVVSQTVQRVLNGRAPRPLRRRRPDPLPHLRRATPIEGVIAAATRPEAIGRGLQHRQPGREHAWPRWSAWCSRPPAPTSSRSPSTPARSTARSTRTSAAGCRRWRRRHALLGWRATTPAREGIAKTVAWARATPWYLALKP